MELPRLMFQIFDKLLNEMSECNDYLLSLDFIYYSLKIVYQFIWISKFIRIIFDYI